MSHICCYCGANHLDEQNVNYTKPDAWCSKLMTEPTRIYCVLCITTLLSTEMQYAPFGPHCPKCIEQLQTAVKK